MSYSHNLIWYICTCRTVTLRIGMCDSGINMSQRYLNGSVTLPGHFCGIFSPFSAHCPTFISLSAVSYVPPCVFPTLMMNFLSLSYLIFWLNFTPISVISPFPFLGWHLELKAWTMRLLLNSCTQQVLMLSWRLNIGLGWYINFIILKIGWHQSPLLLSGTWQSKTNPLSLS